jgi:hypothetical protein
MTHIFVLILYLFRKNKRKISILFPYIIILLNKINKFYKPKKVLNIKLTNLNFGQILDIYC